MLRWNLLLILDRLLLLLLLLLGRGWEEVGLADLKVIFAARGLGFFLARHC